MANADYFVLILVLAAYLGWIFQGDRDFKPHDPSSAS
jgi:hypothetical protein